MEPSIINLLGMRFAGVKVNPQPNDKVGNKDIETFDFEGVEIGEASNTFLIDEDDPYLYGVILKFTIDNTAGTIAPYDIEVCVLGHFRINESVPLAERHNLISVNGCSILYGAIREQVMNITARSVHGMLVLPTASFKDKIKKEDKQNVEKKESITKRKKILPKTKKD